MNATALLETMNVIALFQVHVSATLILPECDGLRYLAPVLMLFPQFLQVSVE